MMSRNVVARPLFQVGKGGWQDGKLLNAQGEVISTFPEVSGLEIVDSAVNCCGISNCPNTIPVYQSSGVSLGSEQKFMVMIGLNDEVVIIEASDVPHLASKIQKEINR